MSIGVAQLAILVSIAAIFGLLAKLLRQPIVLAYLLAGVVIGWLGFLKENIGLYELLSSLGVMFLLFLVGLEINYSSLRFVGRSALIIGLGQIVFTFLGGWLVASLLGFSYVAAAYIGIALTFSSTIIVVKLLSEKRDLNSLYGKVSIGVLLVQDFVAMFLLVFLGSVGRGATTSGWSVLLTIGEGIGLVVGTLWFGRWLIPLIFDRVARSLEVLFLMSLAWVFVTAAVVHWLGFPVEIGGLLAGLALANSSDRFEIAGRIRPLRDFFLLIFFVLLGSALAGFDFSGLTWAVVVLAAFVVIGNPLVVLLVMGALGYHRRTSFLTGIAIAQISEFSFVLVALGRQLGHLDQSVVVLITTVGAVTIATSSYLILHAEKLYERVHPWLRSFESPATRDEGRPHSGRRPSVILFGAHRYGQSLLPFLAKRNVLIVDFDPDVVMHFRRKKYAAVFGDLSDPDLLEQLDVTGARFVVSTSPDVGSNVSFLAALHRRRVTRRPIVIIRAENDAAADQLYQAGADYVLLPYLTTGQYLGQAIAGHLGKRQFRQRKLKDIALLRQPFRQ